MKKLTLAMLAMAAGISAPADAATVIYHGSYSASDPVFARPDGSGALADPANPTQYDVYAFHVTQSGTYSFDLASPPKKVDTVLALYQGAFDANAPLSNLIAFNDNKAAGSGNSSLLESLVAGASYFAVATTTRPRMFGAHTLTISGEGDILEGGPTTGAVPEPATWAMLVSGFGLVGAAFRRRRTNRVSA